MVVGKQDPGHERDRHQSSAMPCDARAGPRDERRHRLRTRLDRQRSTDEHARSRMPRRPPCSSGAPPKPRPSSTTRARRCRARARGASSTLRCLRMAGDVRQALLGDAVDGELRVRGERRQRSSNRRSTRTPETRANVVDSSISALTRPRCSSISGRSSLEMRRTSSRALPHRLSVLVDLCTVRRARSRRSSSAGGARP